MTYYTYIETPVGKVLLTGDGETLNAIYWDVYKHTPSPGADWIEDKAKFTRVLRQLDDYFSGKRTIFDIIHQAQGTEFQKRVWTELAKIPHGETRTYQQIANAIGAPKSVRAVASAIGRNPLSIIVPCHRVLGSNGKLTGFAGGIESKRALLVLEGVHLVEKAKNT